MIEFTTMECEAVSNDESQVGNSSRTNRPISVMPSASAGIDPLMNIGSSRVTRTTRSNTCTSPPATSTRGNPSRFRNLKGSLVVPTAAAAAAASADNSIWKLCLRAIVFRAASLSQRSKPRRITPRTALVFAVVALFAFLQPPSPQSNCRIHFVAHAMSHGAPVSTFVSKVYPQNNPYETYPYYDALPLCTPAAIHYDAMSIGQILRGDRLATLPFQIYYNVNKDHAPICDAQLSPNDLEVLRYTIERNYVIEYYIDNLPVSTNVGFRQQQLDGKYKYLLFTNVHFVMYFNRDQEVVGVSIAAAQDTVDISAEADTDFVTTTVPFTYSVTWSFRDAPTHARLTKQLSGTVVRTSSNQGGLDVHWLAITNSFVLVLFITSVLLLIILRVVRSDLAAYLRIPDEELAATEDESGWKLLHADVFRPPPHRMWFCACVGSGAHLFLVILGTVVIGAFSSSLDRGKFMSIALLSYFLTTFVAGFISANLYRRLGGNKWTLNILVTVLMFMGPFFIIWLILNLIGLLYRSSAALPFSTVGMLFTAFFFVTTPLTVFGAILGRRSANLALEKKHAFPCKTNRLAREIPLTSLQRSPWLQTALSGIVPFSAIYIELHYILLSVWSSQTYTLYGVLLAASIMLLLVAGTVSVLLTYIHLNSENHKWWWRALASGGSVSGYFYLHCVYYFFSTSRMGGLLQAAFFFGYSLAAGWALFLILGFVTFSANYLFVSYLYSSIKAD